MRVVPTPSRRLAGAPPSRGGWHRPRDVPATAIPRVRERKRAGTIVALLLHGLLLLFLLSPAALLVDPNLKEIMLGAGGSGPAGGGGGGNSGTGGVNYVHVAPPKPPPIIAPQLVIEPPKPVEPVIPPLEMPKLAEEQKIELKVQSPVVGIGGGTGSDRTRGNGPGTGGGVGTGVGTGRGSGLGSGTGGGGQENYPPSPTELFIPPMPMPSSVRGFQLIVDFDIDEKGKVIGLVFTPSRDGGYNRKLQEYLKSFKFRPGTTLKGDPIRAKYQMIVDF